MKIGSASKALALVVVVLLGLTLAGGVARAQPAEPTQPTQPEQPEPIIPPYPYPIRVVNLVVGCNNISLTYPDGTPVNVVEGSVNPPGALYALWRLNPMPPGPLPGPRYEGYAPAAPEASDLQGVSFLEAAFLCVSVQSTVTMPEVTPYPVPLPMPEPTIIPMPQ